jgi:hypothetical protein
LPSSWARWCAPRVSAGRTADLVAEQRAPRIACISQGGEDFSKRTFTVDTNQSDTRGGKRSIVFQLHSRQKWRCKRCPPVQDLAELESLGKAACPHVQLCVHWIGDELLKKEEESDCENEAKDEDEGRDEGGNEGGNNEQQQQQHGAPMSLCDCAAI